MNADDIGKMVSCTTAGLYKSAFGSPQCTRVVPKAGLRLRAKKCTFATQKLVYLDHKIITAEISLNT